MSLSLFQAEETYSSKWYIFKNSPLGQLHSVIPWSELAGCLPKQKQGRGAPRWFSNEGMLGLMFLKAYLNISDEKLIERFNTDWSLQLFCGRLLPDHKQIKDKGIVSRTRDYLSKESSWEELQKQLLTYWKPSLEHTHVLLMDATCYESEIRYPTDVKLLWESCHWLFEKQLYSLCKELKIRRPRSKYLEQKSKQLDYFRMRRKSYKATIKRKRSLIYLLAKGLKQVQQVIDAGGHALVSSRDYKQIKLIKKILKQQKLLMLRPGKQVKDRIVSLPKPYVRPIVRGKENKRVEFGMKAHLLQVDGISIIEHMSFDNFNESTRLKISSIKHQSLLGSLHQLGADRIYATNTNRKYLTKKEIFTCFPKKGPKTLSKEEQKLKSLLAAQRATQIEGSFGNHKQHYGLKKIKVKGEEKEKLWVFFAVMTANAVRIAKGKQLKESPPKMAA